MTEKAGMEAIQERRNPFQGTAIRIDKECGVRVVVDDNGVVVAIRFCPTNPLKIEVDNDRFF